MIDHGLQVLGPFPDCQLPVRSSSVSEDLLDVFHFAAAPELIDFRGNKFQNLMDQTARLDFAAAAEIDELSIKTIARGPPTVLIDHAAAINPK